MGLEQAAHSLSIHSVPLELCKVQLPGTGGLVSGCLVVCLFPFPSKVFLPGFLLYVWGCKAEDRPPFCWGQRQGLGSLDPTEASSELFFLGSSLCSGQP